MKKKFWDWIFVGAENFFGFSYELSSSFFQSVFKILDQNLKHAADTLQCERNTLKESESEKRKCVLLSLCAAKVRRRRKG